MTSVPPRRPTPINRPLVAANDPMMQSRAKLVEYEKGLLIDKNDLDGELIRHSERYYLASKEHSLAASYRDEAKKKLAEAEAETAIGCRRDAATAGNKITEAGIGEFVETNADVKNKFQQYTQWSLLESQWKALTTAIQDRRWVISDLVKLIQIQFFDSPERGGDTRALGEMTAAKVRQSGS